MERPRKRRSKRSKDFTISRNKKAAIKTAAYYSDCYVRGISAELANKATKDSQNHYKKWWLQQFGDYSKQNFGDACAVPRYNPPNQIQNNVTKMILKKEEEKNGTNKKRLASSLTESENPVIIPNEEEILEIDSPSYYAVTDNGWEMVGIYKEQYHSLRPFDTLTTTTSQIERNDSTHEQDTVQANFRALENVHPNSSTSISPSNIVSEIECSSDEVNNRVDDSTNDINVEIQAISTKRINNGNKQSKIQDGEDSFHYHQNEIDLLSPSSKYSSFYHEASRAWCTSFANRNYTENKHRSISLHDVGSCSNVQNMKRALIEDLSSTGGDVTSKRFLALLEHLRTVYCNTKWDARDPLGKNFKETSTHTEGLWLTLSRPHYQESLGRNKEKDYMYTLGRMSFDMFYPTNLVCSIQGIFNQVETVDLKDRDTVKGVPKALRRELKRGRNVLRTYNIMSAFTVEPSSPQFETSSPNHMIQRPLHGVMKTYGYALPDPLTRNRFSIWFSNGRLEVNDDNNDNTEWKKAFGKSLPKRQLQERAWILAAKFLLGATIPDKIEPDGSMSFEFSRPIGGHGTTFVDVIYLDENLRIMQGHRGSLFVFTKIQSYNKKDALGL